MDKLLNKRHVEEARLFAILLTFCGGFLDAFTYIQCGHTLAAAQTGNIVFLSAALVNHNVIGIVDRCGAIILYILGIIVAWTEYGYHHDRADLIIGFDYFLIVLAFTTGAISSAVIQPFLRMKTIWVAVLVILITDIIYYFQKKRVNP